MITTFRCSLSTVKEEDFDDIKKLVQDTEVRKYLGGIVDTERIMDQCKHMKNSEDQFYWTVKRKLDDCFIGLISLDNYHDSELKELSYQFVPEFWGQGYATEVARAVLDFAFHSLCLSSVVAETQTANLASIRLLQRLGMKESHTLIRFGESQTVFQITDKSTVE